MSRRGLDAEQVLAEAVRIADADGLPAVTLARVAAALGVRAPSLYNHVDSHEALLRAVALQGLRELGEALRLAALGRARADALAAVAGAYRAYAHAHPGRFAAAAAVSAPGSGPLRPAAEQVDAALAAVAGSWGLEGADAVHAARTVHSALHGFVALEAAGGFAREVDPDASFAALVRTLAAGLDAAHVADPPVAADGDRDGVAAADARRRPAAA